MSEKRHVLTAKRDLARIVRRSACLFCLLVTGFAVAGNGSVAIARLTSPLTIDGDLKDWPLNARQYPVSTLQFGQSLRSDDDLRARFRVAFEPEQRVLFVAVTVVDDSVYVDHEKNGWNETDGCELYLSSGPNSSVRQYSVYGKIQPGRADDAADVRVAVRRGDSSFTYEWALRLSGETQPLRVGFDLAVCDRDADGSFSWLSWGPETTKVRSSDRLGDLLIESRERGVGSIEGYLSAHELDSDVGSLPVVFESTDSLLRFTARTDFTGRFQVEALGGSYQLSVGGARVPGGHVVVRADQKAEFDGGRSWARPVVRRLGPGTRARLGGGYQQLNYREYSAADGIPDGEVCALAQDKEGRLWIGSVAGLASVDGAFTRQYSIEDGLESDQIGALLYHRERLWIGTPRGLACLSGDQLICFPQVSDHVLCLAVDRKNRLLVGTNHALYRFEDVDPDLSGETILALSCFRSPGGFGYSAIEQDVSSDSLWVVAGGSLQRFDGREFEIVPDPNRALSLPIHSLVCEPEGRVWLAGHMSLLSYQDGAFQSQHVDGGVIRDLGVAADGRLWVASHVGVSFLPKNRRLLRLRKIPAQHARSLFFDRDGALWVGFRDRLGRLETSLQSISEYACRAVDVDPHGAVWYSERVGAQSFLKKLVDGSVREKIPLPRKVVSLSAGRRGVWIGTWIGLLHYDGQIVDRRD
ncbi:MAG: two-component regulator propeller domain-containing protein, partial [Planctomycetota bacterium]